MDAPRRPEAADPEFDPAPASPVGLRDFDPLDHQRLVVNPFLALFLAMLWWLAARWLLLYGPFPPMAVATAIVLPVLPAIIHYHCLDCGQTGAYPYRSRHACPAVLARWADRQRPRFSPPSARSQLVFWAYFIGSATLFMTVLGGR